MKQVARKYGLDLIVLFGSQAKGRARHNSDVDLAVRFRPGLARPGTRKLEIASQFDALFPSAKEVDVSFLNDAGSILLFEVATSGRLLYERQPLLFWQFQSYAARRYDDDYKYRMRRSLYLEHRAGQWARSKKTSSARS
ncbi:MAG: nucleotidyltransferase domain-containing protein [Chloroflexi bacterium]|nr:nucleotidyltransferase domain-containing protein [Chloroflexota bacterium]